MSRVTLLRPILAGEGSPSRRHAILALDQALRAADPKRIIHQKIRVEGNKLVIESVEFDLSRFERILVIGAGKATLNMALAIEQILGKKISAGLVNIPDYQRPWPESGIIKFHEASHPIPSEKGVEGVRKMFELVGTPSRKDLVICLISGGGSSLLSMPLPGITLSDIQVTTNLLLRSGAEIKEINTVRKHLSSVKGGRLAQRLFPATVLSLIISDVVGDHLDSIASGPTAPDPTTYADARKILSKYGLWDKVSGSIRNKVSKGMMNRPLETPKPGSKIFDRVFNILAGTNYQSCLAAKMCLKKLGYNVFLLSTQIEGEAKDVGKICSAILRDIQKNGLPVSSPGAIVAGGETTVTLKGNGKGGRNQELVLSAAIGIASIGDGVIASMGTDGVDGPTDAAGAIADSSTLLRASRLGLDPNHFLETHDSYHFFKKLGDLIVTGPTGTNVNDIMVLIAGKIRSEGKPGRL